MRTCFLIFLFVSLSLYSSGSSSGVSLNENGQELYIDPIPFSEADVALQKNPKWETGPAPAPLVFEEEKLQNFKTDPEFDYSEDIVQDNWWTRFKSYLKLKYYQFMSWLFGDYEANSVLWFLVKLLPYLVILLVILLAVWVFHRMNPAALFFNEPEEAKVFLSEEEEIIKTSDISDLIRKAVSEENFRLAIRFYFLLILQQLTRKEIIAYEFSKTDEDYLNELKPEPLQQQFKQLTRIYDFIWYGSFETSREHFLRSEREFQKMQDLIQQLNE